MHHRPTLLAASCLIMVCVVEGGARAEDADASKPFRFEIPPVVLREIPVQSLRIQALDSWGDPDRSVNGPAQVQGIQLIPDDQAVEFVDGVLELKSQISAGRRVLVTSEQLSVRLPDGRSGTHQVRRLPAWFSLLPPLVAIVLALWIRNVFVALFLAVLAGAVTLAGGNLLEGFLRTLDTYLLHELTQPGRSGEHMQIILFTMFLGSMIGVMTVSGGTRALVDRLSRFTRTREHGQVLTWALGLVVFFDDYANTLLVGGTMRPVADRLRFSREKLAFLLDATAAPVAGLAVISTWVGFELGQIETAFHELGVEDPNVFATLVATIPYRFYPLYLLAFVGLLAWSGRDYGPMLAVERRTLEGEASGPVEERFADESSGPDPHPQRLLARNAVIPIVVLLTLVGAGMARYPNESLAVLLVGSFVASLAAVLSVLITRALSLQPTIEGWLNGARSMFLGLVVLVLAWAIATLCDDSHLNTAGYLVELIGEQIPTSWLPTLAFLLSAAVSFATGSSFATMGLLIPLFISMTFYLLPVDAEVFLRDATLLGTVGAVLAGSIFGDHCSPISDTTVLSSAAAGCDHLAHVATQMPYALSVAVIALVFGYLPAGFGVSPWLLLPCGLLALYGLVRLLGKHPGGGMDGS